MNIKLDNYEIEILVQGFPGKSVYHGGLGWSTIALIRTSSRVVVVDGGPFGMRGLLNKELVKRGIKPAQVTDMMLTHAHHDHMVNWVLFRHARIAIGKQELEWASKAPWGSSPVPEAYVQELQRCPTLQAVNDGDEVLPGITAHLAPGHTPGGMVYVLHGSRQDVIFTGDAVKNRAEFVSRTTDMTYDAAVSAATINMVWELWQRRPGTIVIPGHDVAMVQENGRTRYLDERPAAILAWYGDDMESTTRFDLTGN
ncbi:MAG: MBL fold metallo-hydrolase [Candidatus Korobacteraceae bacterium]|jgi:glyoxylase-like metal-dependent hydrolase (beta-lactamase superfamily II)